MADPQTPPATPPQSGKPGDGPKAQSAAADTPKPPIVEILDRLQRSHGEITEYDRTLASTVRDLIRQSNDPLRLNQRSFQHEVSYAFQDVERHVGTVPLSSEARAEVTRLATSAPGLENDRILSLMRATASLSDHAVIRDIRRAGGEIGQQADQNTAAIRSQIDVLENRVRLAQRPPEPSPEPASRPTATAEAASAGRPNKTERLDGSAGADANRRADEAAQQQRRAGNEQPFQSTVLDSVLRGLRGNTQASSAPWDPLPTPFADRLNAFQNAMRAGRDDIVLRDAEKAGRAAFDALEGFRTGEGATVTNRIQAAARSEPGGIASVLSEMREGGRFQDLRQQFNNALTDEKGFARAYDRAASALAEYGQARAGIEQVIARRPDAGNLTARFEQLDAQIGEAAGNTPSRREGKTMIDDIARHAAEIVQRAVDAVKSVFSRDGADISRPTASPLMSA